MIIGLTLEKISDKKRLEISLKSVSRFDLGVGLLPHVDEYCSNYSGVEL